MFISFFFNIHYEGDCYHWYLDTLNYAHHYNYPLITSEEYNFLPYATNPLVLDPSFPKKHELERNVTEAERDEVEQYFVPIEFLKGNLREKEARTEIMLRLIEKRSPALENYLDGILQKILEKHPNEQFEAFLFFGECYESVRLLAEKYHCPVITYELSAIRTDVAYTQTLICANMSGRQYGSFEGKSRYEKFKSEMPDVPYFTRKELIALFGKESTLPLVPLIEIEPKYEMGICGWGQCIIPMVFASKRYTDDDLKAECATLYSPEQRLWRQHLGFLSYTEVLESRLDPEFFILSCRRIAAVCSNILTEAMLWNRTACCNTNLITFSFLCEEDFSSESKVTELALNYQFFGLFVPGYSNLFDPEYWRWRFTGPTETEIYRRHMQICLKKAGLDESIFNLNGEARLCKILENRGLSSVQIEQVFAPFDRTNVQSTDFRILLSAAEISDMDENGNLTSKWYWCRNKFESSKIFSEFQIDNLGINAKVRFLPLLDMGGFVSPIKAILNGKEIQLEGYTRWIDGEWYDYLPKYGFLGYTANLNNENCISGRSSLILVWKYKELGEGRYYELSSIGKEQRIAENELEAANLKLQLTQEKLDVKLSELSDAYARLSNSEVNVQSLNKAVQDLSELLIEYEKKLQESNEKLTMTEESLKVIKAALDNIENATCWKLTKPLRIILDFLKELLRW